MGMRGKRRAVILLAAVAIVALGAGAGAGAQQARKGKTLLWGATIGEQFTGDKAPWDMGAVSAFQSLAGKPLSVISFFSPWMDCSTKPCTPFKFPTTPLESVRRYGAIPFFSWASDQSPPRVHNPKFQLADIIHGRFDSYIRTFAHSAKVWGHPFFLRFDWEMNGFWNPWGQRVNGNRPRQYRKAWRHVHRIFTEEGATNASWVWCPNIDLSRKLFPLERLYPGNRFVDWTCMSGFNWGKRADSAGWQSFDTVFRSTYRRIVHIAPHKPMILGEVGSNERGGSKAHWIQHMLRAIAHHYPKMRGFIWFDVNDRGTNWPIESSKAATRAFRRGIASPAFATNRFGQLAGSPIRPPR
jgi:hypothetical protein